jgi:hypothetical protein
MKNYRICRINFAPKRRKIARVLPTKIADPERGPKWGQTKRRLWRTFTFLHFLPAFRCLCATSLVLATMPPRPELQLGRRSRQDAILSFAQSKEQQAVEEAAVEESDDFEELAKDTIRRREEARMDLEEFWALSKQEPEAGPEFWEESTEMITRKLAVTVIPLR